MSSAVSQFYTASNMTDTVRIFKSTPTLIYIKAVLIPLNPDICQILVVLIVLIRNCMLFHPRDCFPKFANGLNIKIDIAQKVYEF